MMKIQIVVWSVALALAGCGSKKEGGESSGGGAAGGGGGGGGGKVVASCDQRAVPMAGIKVCLEYTGNVWTKKEVQARCGLEGQVFIDGPCPTDGVVYTCVQESGGPMEAYNRYYDKPEKAATICKAIGVPK